MGLWLAFALCLGPLTHYIYFIKDEHHLRAPLYFRIFIVTAALSYSPPVRALLWRVLGVDRPHMLLPIYLVSLFPSIASYRLLFHPLRDFPGPRLVAVSKLWQSWLCRTGQNYRVLGEWAEKYGEFVRTGKRS